MSINLSDNINYRAPKHGDARYGPWTGVTHANENVLALQRAIGLTVGIRSGNTLTEYWYYSGVTDSDLILKTGAAEIDLSNYARTDTTNTFTEDQEFLGFLYVSGATGVVRVAATGIRVSNSDLTRSSNLSSGNLALSSSDESNVFVSLRSIDTGHTEYFLIALNGDFATINPQPGPSISMLYPDGFTNIIGFEPYTGFTDGRVTFYTPIIGMSGATIAGDVDITGQYLINGVPFTGGTLDHTELYNLLWANSSHTGTPNMLAGFDGSGNAVYYPLSSGTTVSTDPNTGISVISGSTINTIYNSALSSNLETPEDVGGITAGTTVAELTGKTLVEIVNDLLFPTVQPTYTIPTITMTGVTSQTLEVGSEYAPYIGVYADKNDAGAFTRLRVLRGGIVVGTYNTLVQSSISDIASQFGYADPNNPNYRYTISPNPFYEPTPVVDGSFTYQVDGNYGSGVAKQDNKGNYDTRSLAVRSVNAPQSGDTNFVSTLYTISGIYPYFYGDSATLPTASSIAADIEAGSGTKVLSAASGTLSIPYNVTGRYIWVAYPSSYTTKTVWWVNALDNGDIDDSFITTVSTQSVDSPDFYWAAITYKMHWSVYTTTQNTFEFRNT